MVWILIIAVPICLGLAFAGFALGTRAVCRKLAPRVAENEWFPTLVTGAFAAVLLILLPIYEAWLG